MEVVLYFIEVSYIYALTIIFIGTVLTSDENDNIDVGDQMCC